MTSKTAKAPTRSINEVIDELHPRSYLRFHLEAIRKAFGPQPRLSAYSEITGKLMPIPPTKPSQIALF